MRPVTCILCLLSLAAPSPGQDVRFVEFRDGSVLRLPVVDEAWPVTVIRPNGQLQQSSVRLSQLDGLSFTQEKGFARKQAMLAAVRRLGADDFLDREQAQVELTRHGPDIRADLENCLSFTTDSEARIRLQAILRAQPLGPGSKSSAAVFDRFRLNDDCWGHLGDSGLPVQHEGKTHRLTREHVARVNRPPPPFLWIRDLRPSGAAPFERIAASEFPSGCIEEAFERTPSGRTLEMGTNIERLFIDKGFVLSTSIADSFVSVNNFKVEGKSGGMSVASQQPLWEGAITVRFVEPGREQSPAGVHYFGCWIAAVVPNGTSMIAYDRLGHELGRVITQTHGNDFLGMRSATPIHRVQIVPNVQFDRDYTLDDFVYSPPHNPESRSTTKFIVQIKNGSRVLCSDVSLEPDGVRLQGMPGGLPDWTMPLADIERIAFPGPAVVENPHALYAELSDGSIIAGRLEGKQPKFARLPKVLEDSQLRAVWSGTEPRRAPPAVDKSLVWNSEQSRWHEISDVRFLEEIVIWKLNGEFQAAPYAKLPMLRFSGGTPMASASWRVLTEEGDELGLQTPMQFRGRLSQGLTAAWQNQPVQLMRSEMRFLVQVR